MKKVFLVWMEIEFNIIKYEREKWYKPCKKNLIRETCVVGHSYKYILAKDKEEAYSLYKKRNTYKNKEEAISYTLDIWSLRRNPLNRKNIEPKLNICSSESIASLEELKKELSHQEFFELCKQEMYPIEVIMR